MQSNEQLHANAAREAIDGRMPVLSDERLYTSYGSILWICTANSATWAFLIGGNLPIVGNTVVGMVGYLCGMILGFVPVGLASGLPSYRYGIDPIDGAKAAFGTKGAVIALVISLSTLVGWAYVLVALTARGVVSLASAASAATIADEPLQTLLALFALLMIWLITRRGPAIFRRLSAYVAPLQLVVTGVLLVILLHRYGPTVLWSSNIPASLALTQSHTLGFAYAVEFGVSNAFSWWPVMGGLTRLTRRRRHVLGPVIVGGGVLGAAFISAVGALAAARVGTTDPSRWMLVIGGARLGTALLAFFLLSGIVTMVLLVYLAAVASQQLRRLSRLSWDLLLFLILLPGIYFAFRTAWVLRVVMTWLSYNGVMFEGIIGILLVDYLVLRRQSLDARHLFTRSPAGKYWYWGGVNWVAVMVVAASVPIYLAFYNPTTYRVAASFRYLGAALPTMLLAAFAYLLLTYVCIRPAGKGGYLGSGAGATSTPTRSGASRIEVTL